jgi:small-conductance mechanosensitive channel
MTEQPEPLRLAQWLEQGNYSHEDVTKAAAELRRLHGEVERLRANRDFWHQACLQAQEHRDGANASNAVWEAETVKLRAEVERLRAELARLTKPPSPPPLWGKGCPVCGMFSQPGVYGVVCARGDCPTRVTCGVTK